MKITPEMVRAAEAHFPYALAEGPAKGPRWQWFADFYNHAMQNPGTPCPCCNVTPDGDIMDHLPPPPAEAQPVALDYVPGELDRTSPPRVWLQIDTTGNNSERDDEWPGPDHVTWQDESVGGLEIQYVRADLAPPPSAPKAQPVAWSAWEKEDAARHNVAAKDDEIEQLRAERDLFRAETIALAKDAERLAEALRELLIDMEQAQNNMRAASRNDSRWEGCAEAIQPRVDAAKNALRDQEGRHDP